MPLRYILRIPLQNNVTQNIPCHFRILVDWSTHSNGPTYCYLCHLLALLLTDNVQASFPGSWEKRAWYILFALAQFQPRFWEFGNFHKICSVTLTSVRHANFSHIKKMPATDHTLCRRSWGSDEGTQPFICRNCPCVRPFQLNTVACDWCNLSLWSSPIALNEAIQTITVKAILLLT